MANVIEITAATTVAQLFGKAKIADLLKSEEKFFEAIDGHDDLIAALEQYEFEQLTPETVNEAAEAYLAKVKAELAAKPKTGSESKPVETGGFKFATTLNSPVVMTRTFVLESVRFWGEMKTSRTAKASVYRQCTLGGHYLVTLPNGDLQKVPDSIITNSSLIGSLNLKQNVVTVAADGNPTIDPSTGLEKFSFKEIDIESDETQWVDKSFRGFQVNTAKNIANVTTYKDMSEAAILAAKKAKESIHVGKDGIPFVYVYHTVSNDFVFRGFGTSITKAEMIKTLEQFDVFRGKQLEQQMNNLADRAKSELKIAEEKALIEAKSQAVSNQMGALLGTLTENADKLQALNIDAQALMIAALTGNK